MEKDTVMNKFLKKLLNDAKGTTAIEYVLIAALVCAVMFAGMKKVGNGYKQIYNRISDNISHGGDTSSGNE